MERLWENPARTLLTHLLVNSADLPVTKGLFISHLKQRPVGALCVCVCAGCTHAHRHKTGQLCVFFMLQNNFFSVLGCHLLHFVMVNFTCILNGEMLQVKVKMKAHPVIHSGLLRQVRADLSVQSSDLTIFYELLNDLSVIVEIAYTDLQIN